MRSARGARRATEHWARRPADEHGALRGGSLDAVYASRITWRIPSYAPSSPATDRNSTKLRRLPLISYWRAGNVTFLPPPRRSQTPKPMRRSPGRWTALGSKDHFRVGELPLGRITFNGKNLHRHHVAVAVGHVGPPWKRRGSGPTALAMLRELVLARSEVGRTAAEARAWTKNSSRLHFMEVACTC